jgi:hypothetical protein
MEGKEVKLKALAQATLTYAISVFFLSRRKHAKLESRMQFRNVGGLQKTRSIGLSGEKFVYQKIKEACELDIHIILIKLCLQNICED